MKQPASIKYASPLIIGLTGGIASGKTTVANYLASKGAYLIDTDIIAREVVAPNSHTTQSITALLGKDYLHDDGHLNRAKIKQLIFNDAVIKKQYEDIILPAIRQATLEKIAQTPKDVCYAVLIVPLLFEKGLDQYTQYNLVVDIPEEEQIRRGIARKPDDEAVIRQVIAAQMPRKDRNARADFIIDNTVALEKLQKQLDILHNTLCNLKHTTRTTE